MLVFGLTFPILFDKPKLGAPLVMLSFLIGFSVVYLGFHFPGDVIAGAFFSLLFSLCVDNMKPHIELFLDHYRIKK